jgi:hypothetical protein
MKTDCITRHCVVVIVLSSLAFFHEIKPWTNRRIACGME